MAHNPSFEIQIPNGSKSHTVRDVPQWYLGVLVAKKPVLGIANSQWLKVSYSQGCPRVVSRCSGGSQTRPLKFKFPMIQSLIQLGMPPSGIWVFWWLRNPSFESQIPNGSKSQMVRDVPQWYLGVLVAHNPSFEIQIPNGSKSHTVRDVPQWYLGVLVAHNPSFESQIPNGSESHTVKDVP